MLRIDSKNICLWVMLVMVFFGCSKEIRKLTNGDSLSKINIHTIQNIENLLLIIIDNRVIDSKNSRILNFVNGSLKSAIFKRNTFNDKPFNNTVSTRNRFDISNQVRFN